ncbi:MAG: hypothetical protein HFJ41_01610 [Clostridia bacterium]|nr:hypothetical protein [Clostridia bacterium]
MVEHELKDKLKNELENTIKKYGIDYKKNYKICKMLSIENDKKYNNKSLQNYYLHSIITLTEYMKANKENPSEIKWNRYAIKKGCLSSKTIGYMYEDGFNSLCRQIRKAINKNFFF